MNKSTLLYRQINACHIQNGYVSSSAFRPRKADNDKLSVYDGDKITPDQAFRHYTEDLKGSSEGVLGVTKEECDAESLPVVEDYATHPYHVLIDFSGNSNNACRKISERLREAAVKRGWLFEK